MENLFCTDHLDEVFKTVVPPVTEGKYQYGFKNHHLFNSVGYLDIRSEEQCFEYVLVKILSDSMPGANGKYFPTLKASLFLESKKDKIFYGVFKKQCLKNYESPIINSVANLKTILTSLAKFQAEYLSNHEVEPKEHYNIQDVADKVLSTKFFQPQLEDTKVKEVLKNAQTEIDKLLHSSLLVPTIWANEGSNVFLNHDNSDAIFLDVGFKHFMPPAYDALRYIFALSDETFRKYNFEDLTFYYFEELRSFLKNQKKEFLDGVKNSVADLQVRTLLPAVKFEIIRDLAHSNCTRLIELQKNLIHYLKYPYFPQEDIYEITENKLLTKEYNLISFELKPLDERNGHLGEYFHLSVEATHKNQTQKFTVFAKVVIVTAELLQEILNRGAGKKEYFFYNTLLPMYRSHGLEQLLDFAPQCYLARFNTLVLEDLGQAGYKGLRPNSVLNADGLKLVIGKLARFHACGVIVEELESNKNGKLFRFGTDYKETMTEGFQLYEGELMKFFNGSIDALIHVFEKLPHLTKDLKYSPEEFSTELRNFYMSKFTKLKTSKTLRNVINHGDTYIGNMMFKFDKKGDIEEGILVDFQLLRYVPPCCELLSFIYVCSTKETRIKYLEELIDYYYKTFSDSLKNFNVDVNHIISKELFYEEVNRIKSASISVAFDCSHLTHSNPDLREEVFHDEDKAKYYLEVHRDKYVDLAWNDDHYRSIVTGLAEDIIDLIKLGY